MMRSKRRGRLHCLERLEDRLALTVYISEFAARNDSIQTIAGDTPDWIEIHNSSDEAIDVQGFHLTDSVDDPVKWEFPSVQIPADGYLVVFASGQESTVEELHANFALSGDGEYLALTDAEGNVVHAFSPTFPEQYTDITYGLNAAGENVYFATATPGTVNSSEEYLPAAEANDDFLPGDIDRSGKVDFADFIILSKYFGKTGTSSQGDVDGDGTVGFADFILLAANFGRTKQPSSTSITLHGDTASVSGSGASAEGGDVRITSPGTYRLSGSLNDGQIVVDSTGNGAVNLILDGVDITSSNNAAVHVVAADETRITLSAGTQNILTDGATYEVVGDGPDAALFSQDDLIINGSGSLTVDGRYNDGIVSKDDLEINGGHLIINAVNHGIQGKDSVVITDGDVTIYAGGDGIQASNEEEADKGYIDIEGGDIKIRSDEDGIQAETNLAIAGGTIHVLSGGGHTSTSEAGKGLKAGTEVSISAGNITVDAGDDAIHSDGNLVISGGTLTLATADDAVHADALIDIRGGVMEISSSYEGIEGLHIAIDQAIIAIVSENDGISAVSEAGVSSTLEIDGSSITVTAGTDAIEAEANVIIRGGDFQLTSGGGSSQAVGADDSAKGIKSDAELEIQGGTFVINSADDAIHSNGSIMISAGNLTISTGDDGIHADTSIAIDGGTINVLESYEGIESEDITINDGTIQIVSSDDGINIADPDATAGGGPGGPGGGAISGQLYINGGYIAVNADGDGLDSNGSITMTGGTVIVHGPTVEFNGALDADGTILVNGGFLIAVGSSRMAEWPDASSTQETLAFSYGSTQAAGTMMHVQTSTGEEILTFIPAKNYSSVVLSSPSLVAGTVYDVYSGGSSTGTLADGLFTGGTYTQGTELGSITL